jgi:protein-S-isoprenylcysteine O-methyltransferase Ste14
MFKDPQPFQVMLGIILVIAIIFTALMEEKEMIAKFGDQYREYMHETKRFIPFVI